jgi:hypothetical protein
MAKDQSRRLVPSILAEDEAAFVALQSITNYSPSNPAYTLAAITEIRNRMQEKRTREAQAAIALAAARDDATAAEWEYHNAVLGSRDQVVAQFGKDSNEVQAVGLKKVSEYRKPTRKKAGGDAVQ